MKTRMRRGIGILVLAAVMALGGCGRNSVRGALEETMGSGAGETQGKAVILRETDSGELADADSEELSDADSEELSDADSGELSDADSEELSDAVSDEYLREALLEEQIAEQLAGMSLRKKVLQMFMITPEALTGQGVVTATGDITRQAIAEYPVGGLVYFASNMEDAAQLKTMLSNTFCYYEQQNAPKPFLAVDEEGGTVARIGNHANFSVEQFEDMSAVGARGSVEEAGEIGNRIGAYLSELGFNLDFAPVADVLTNPENTVVAKRSFGSDPQLVTDMALAVAKGLQEQGVCAAAKHFPGHGSTAADTHQGYAYTDKTLEELMAADLVPFQAAASAKIPFIMAAHISVPSVTGDDTPCSLSGYMLTTVLREQLGYEGIVITDAMNMGAISSQYTSAEAAVKAIEAGADIILMPADFHEALEGVLQAVKDGRISERRIDESVRRILETKAVY